MPRRSAELIVPDEIKDGGREVPARVAEDRKAERGLAVRRGYGLLEVNPVVGVRRPGRWRAGEQAGGFGDGQP